MMEMVVNAHHDALRRTRRTNFSFVIESFQKCFQHFWGRAVSTPSTGQAGPVLQKSNLYTMTVLAQLTAMR
jgi:hypothetical protein